MQFVKVEKNKRIFKDSKTGRQFWFRKSGQREYCSHGSYRSRCLLDGCTGSSICKHGKQKPYCKDPTCSEKNIFCKEHGKAKSRCPLCKGASICIHGKRRQTCMFCEPDSPELCNNKCGHLLSDKIARDRGTCYTCERRKNKIIRLEHMWLEKFNEWGYHPTINDKVVRDSECNIINRRRVDFLFATEASFPYHIVVECDENSHGGKEPTCEMARLQEIHDQLIGNLGAPKPIAIIRFNPSTGRKYVENDVKAAMDELFKGEFQVKDIRGVNIFKIIGYGNTRAAMYKEAIITHQISDYSQVNI